MNILRTGLSVAFIYIAVTAMAQNVPATSWHYTDRFPQLPPLGVDFNTDLFTRHQSNLLLMPQGSVQHNASADSRSILFRPKDNETKSHFQFKAAPNIQTGDEFKGLRDYIVRERRRKAGNPLPPPPPLMR